MPSLDIEITTGEAAHLLGITAEWVRQVSKQGYFQPASRGRWRPVEVVQGYLRYLQDEGRRTTKSAADSRVRDARAADIEIRTAERTRRLIGLDEAVEAMDEIIGVLRSELDGFGARMTRDLDLRNQIESEIADILDRAADRLTKRAGDLRESRGPTSPGRPLNS